MHHEALQFANRFGTGEPITVIELGSRDVNGTPRTLFPSATWIGVDIVDGPGVDIVADAATWRPDEPADLVITMEVLEHTPVWCEILATAAACLKPDGRVVVTAAGPHRLPHSAVDGGPLRDDEYYENIAPGDLHDVLAAVGFSEIEVYEVGGDVQATAVLHEAPTKAAKKAA